jgi:hypothetical protein
MDLNLIYRIIDPLGMLRRVYRFIAKYYDPMRFIDLKTTPIIPRALQKKGFLSFSSPVRVIEIGPLWGRAARDLDKRIKIKEFVFIELPEQKESVDLWIDEIKAPHRVIYTNVIFLDKKELSQLGRFDVVYCTGVIYHIAQQLRFCKILFDLLADNGLLVLESYVVDSKDNIVKIFWPKTSAKSLAHHIPSRMAWR